MFFVYFFFTDVIIPAYFTGFPSKFNSLSSLICNICKVLIVAIFSILSFSFSNGCPDIYIPSISFSIDNNSFSLNSSITLKLYFILLMLLSSCPKSNIETCPVKLFLFSPFIVSNMFSNEARSVLLVCSNSSKAPAFIKLSIHFLLTVVSFILSQKSLKSLNSP